MDKYSSPMEAVKALTEFLNDLPSPEIKAQILEIYLEDNEDIKNKLLYNLGL